MKHNILRLFGIVSLGTMCMLKKNQYVLLTTKAV